MPSKLPPGPTGERRRVRLGVIEFHSERVNPGLIQRFRDVTEDLRDAGCIVDLWLFDIEAVLREFGYEMEIYTTKPAPEVPR